jgi:tetratricopeptide (TPR) repeat protein
MKTNDFSYFIERYISNEMGKEEKTWFEKELDGNPSLENELNFRRKTDSIIKNSEIMDLRTKLQTIEKNKSAKKVTQKSRKSQILRSAAVFTGIILLGSIFLFHGRNDNRELIFDKYYKSYESLSATRSALPEVSSIYSEAMNYYNNHDYVNAAQSLEKLLSKDQENIEYRFQLANSYMGMQSYPEAGKSYLKVIEDNNNLFIEDAQWYLALCYYMTNDDAKAKSQLDLIAASESRYKKDARKLLKSIK